ncbi:pyridoxine biosynthesis protein [Coemansia aciculifera]|nr:pyridoxine biosynthesis protein [Coemansia aciculifera]
MPTLPSTMHGVILFWDKKDGESFSAGDLLFQIETEELQLDVDAPRDGVLVKILVEAGTAEVAANTPIAIIAEKGDDPSTIDTTGL